MTAFKELIFVKILLIFKIIGKERYASKILIVTPAPIVFHYFFIDLIFGVFAVL